MALAGLAFFTSVVARHAEHATCPACMWDAAWATARAIAASIASPASPCHASVRVRFVQTLAAMYRDATSKFVPPATYAELFADLSALAAHPVTQAESWPPYFVPAVHTAILAAFPTLLPSPTPLGWDIVADFACDQLAQPPLPDAVQASGALEADAQAQVRASGRADADASLEHAISAAVGARRECGSAEHVSGADAVAGPRTVPCATHGSAAAWHRVALARRICCGCCTGADVHLLRACGHWPACGAAISEAARRR